MFWCSVFNPLIRPRPLEATLRGNDDALRIRIQSLSNEALADVRTIRIRRVKEIDSEFRCAPHDANGLTPIRGFAPDSLAGEPHRTQSEPSNEEIVGNQQFAIVAGGLTFAILWRVLRCAALHRHASSSERLSQDRRLGGT